MEIYLTHKGELEIKSLEPEPWSEADLGQIFDPLLIKLTKVTFEELEIRKIKVDDRFRGDIGKQLVTMKVALSKSRLKTVDKILWPPGHLKLLHFLVADLIEKNYQTCMH